MRHLRRHYFDNPFSDHANEQYVAVIDHGRDSTGAQRYNIVVGTLLTLQEVLTAAQVLLAAPCFFKLPMGATAILDIYIPDSDDSDEPKTFDYQVFKAKLPMVVSEPRAKQFGEAYDKLSQLISHAEAETSGSATPQGPMAGLTGPLGATGATGTACYLVNSGPSGPANPCAGQTGIACADPVFTVAACVGGVLQCVRPKIAAGELEGKKSSE